MTRAQAILTCILLLALAPVVAAQQAPPAPSDVEINRLVAKLGDPDFAAREAATQRLRAIGKPALAALKEAANDADPEIRTRAATLIRRLERRPLPGGPLDGRFNRGPQRHVFGHRRVTIDQGDRQFEIVRTEGDGIRITVTAIEDGKRVTETYEAKDAAELKELEPEAYAVYERWGTGMLPGGAAGFAAGLGLEGQVVFEDRVLRIRDELDVLREQLEEQMKEARLAMTQVRDVMAQLERLQAVRQGGGLGLVPAEPDRQIREYFRLSDLLRAKLAELKLDAGEALPPPPNQRLGVQISMNADALTGEIDGVIVQMVVSDSRAAKIGLREADHIRKINDAPIKSTRDIRDALGKSKGALVVEVVREGKTMKLTEKVEQK